jgi:hypothetical protein
MIIETPGGNSNIINLAIGKVEIPEPMQPYCDTWGNLKIDPVDILEETHSFNFIKVFIYKVDENFYFGYQLRLNRLVMQKQANVLDRPEKTKNAARQVARKELHSIVSKHSKKTLEAFLIFDTICYNQPELF